MQKNPAIAASFYVLCCLAVIAGPPVGWAQEPTWNSLPDNQSMVDPNTPFRLERLPPLEEAESTAVTLERYRRGFFQGAEVTADSVWGLQNDLNTESLDLSVSFAVPLGSFERILVVSPAANIDWVQFDGTLDVPDTLYESGVRFFLMTSLAERWKFIGMAQPMFRSDGTATDDALRIFALALLSWEIVENTLDLSFGAVYLGRNDVPLLPAVGLVWTPTPDWRLDATFPRPRLSWRLAQTPGISEQWAYVAGELGGNTWSVRRSDGTDDQLSLKDYRLLLGFQSLGQGGRQKFVEIGYAFGRHLEYEVGGEELQFSDGLLVRGGIRF